MGKSLGLASNEIFVDLFAGGGGTSTGVEAAIERPVDIAVNHDEAAIAMHRRNHPSTKHYREDVFAVDPREACGSRKAGALWMSPDCTGFSKAKGAQPRNKGIRALANVGIVWAERVRPRAIFLENVEEFEDWGPLDEQGKVIQERKGEDFRAWCGRLSDLGYKIDWRTFVAADYGAPTTRKRLFLQARCDGAPIVWPEPTHGKGRPNAWRAAAEIIDWSLPCPSIFGRKRPLAEATLRRIARGIQRFVIGATKPFIVPVTHQGSDRVHDIDEPLRTVTAANRGELSLVAPFIVRHGHYSTRTGAGLEEGCGAGTFRGQRATTPLATVCATNDKHLVVPFIAKHYGGGVNGKAPPGLDARAPLDTITEQDHHGLTAAFLTKFYGSSTGAHVDEPLPTVTAGGDRGGGHLAEVRAFLMKYHGGERGDERGQLLLEPMRTIDTANRFALVMVHGEPYEIIDIGMRMLSPRELFAAQGFPDSYDIAPELHGKPITKTQQIALAGNSVPPPMAEHIVRAAMYRRACA
jgi:DNA (cytosine-5)-methyltransferase 1